jgi:hypothetical protein
MNRSDALDIPSDGSWAARDVPLDISEAEGQAIMRGHRSTVSGELSSYPSLWECTAHVFAPYCFR